MNHHATMHTPSASSVSRAHEPVVRRVVSWRDRRRFQHLPWTIYAATGSATRAGGTRDANWVPPILAQERQLLGWGRHPFYDDAETVALLAERDGDAVGRLSVLINRVHNRKYADRLGFFGFFECVDDTAVAQALFRAGAEWLRERGMEAVRGPVNPSMNYTCGLLVDGFDRPPRILMPYNPPYYAPLLASCGFHEAHDLLAYELDTAGLATVTERYKPAVLAALAGTNLVLRPLERSRAGYRRQLATYVDLYNRSLEGSWGFTPLQPREARRIANELRHIIVPEFAVFAEVRGEPVGALLALLDFNELLRPPPFNGRLFPFTAIRLLLGRRRITSVRAMAMTMVPGYQNAGLAIVLLDHMVEAAKRWGPDGDGIRNFEFSWILESNRRSRGSLERGGAKIARTYRLYEKSI